MFKVLQLDGPIEIFSPTFPESPSEFWVVCKEDRDRLDRLRNDLSNYFKSRPSENSQGNTRPKVGDVGVLKDNNDVWRRVQVEFSEGGEVDLRDVDDGLLVQSLNRPLFILPPEFQTNFMGIRCRLNGVICKGDQLTWPMRAIEVFRKYFKPVKMRVVGLQMNTHVVDVTIHDNKDMATVLLEAGVAEHLEVEESLKNFKSIVGLKKCLSRFTLVEEFKAPKLPVKNISKNFDTKQEYWITINHTITPNQFYANFLLDSTMELEQLESDLKMHYREHSGNSFMVNVYANLYAVKCEPTGSWKRGSIVELQSGKASVFFYDYGHTKTVSLKDLAPLDGKFSTLPAQAVCCSVDFQGYHWQKQDVEYFRHLVSKSIFSIKIIEKRKDRIVIDFLSDLELRQNMLNFMKATRAEFQKLSTSISEDRSVKSQCIREDTDDCSFPHNDSLLFHDDVVVVMAIESTADFYVMRMNGGDQKKFQELMEDLRNHCTSADICESISLNMPVACKLNDIWARASIVSAKEDQVEVFFVDFGKKMFVKKDKIKSISQKLIEYLPMQCFRCSLKLPSQCSSELCDKWFKNNCMELIFLVSFANKDGNKHVVDLKMKQDKETICQKVLHLSASATNQQLEKPLASDISLSSEVEVQELQEGCQVLVVHVVAPSDFYVQRHCKETEKILEEITLCLNKSTLSPCRKIEEGMLVAVQFEDLWYRAVINEILKDSSVRVLFVDYGNEDVVNMDSVCTTKDRVFVESPYLAQQCRLNGASGRTTAQILNAFKECCLDKMFLVRNLQREAPGLYRLDLLDPETLEPAFDINKILQKQVTFKANTAEHNKTNINMTRERTGVQKTSPNLTQVNSNLPAAGVSVSIKYSKNPFDFYLSEESDNLRILTSRLNDLSPVKVRSCSKGDIVAAVFEELWCRAKILSVLPRDVIRVQFIDYGNIAEVEMGEVKAISQELKDLSPKPVVHCWLALNRNDSMEGCWSQEAVQWFKDNCEWKPYKLSCLRDSGTMGSEGEKIYEVELITAQGESLVEELLRKNILPSKARVPESTKSMVVRADLGTLGTGKIYKCEILKSSSPCAFWCQVIDFMIELVSDKMPGIPGKKEYDPAVSEICLAFHRVHNEWYRVEVKELAGNIAKVHLIDYEEDLSVPFTHLHQLPLQMKRFPPLAFKCSLQGVSPLAPVWTDEANDYFSSLIADQILEVEIIKSDGNVHWVKVVDSNGLSITEKMKAIKLAK